MSSGYPQGNFKITSNSPAFLAKKFYPQRPVDIYVEKVYI